jgi:hypothetical protein
MRSVSSQTTRKFPAFFKKGFLVLFIALGFLSTGTRTNAAELDPNTQYCQSSTTSNIGGLNLPTITAAVNGKCANPSDKLIKGSDVQEPTKSNGAGSGIAYYLAQIIYVFTVGLGSLVASVGAFLLNITISLSLDSAAYGLDFISTGWTMLRDLANMAFIFILVYIALQVMFQAQTHGTVERLVKVLAVALVINFSFFATRVVVDAGNLISVQFYNAIVKDAPQTTINPLQGVSSGIQVPDITKKIMDGVNFQDAIGPDSFKNVTGNGWTDFGAGFISYAFIYIALGAMLFMLAAAFVASGVKFIIRIVMLWFAIITAPLALLAWSFGGGHGEGGHGGGYFTRWLKNLISHAFYPAVFLFVLLLISNFMSAAGAAGLGGGLIQDSIANGQTGVAALAAVIANIAVRLGFVLVMLYVALRASDYFEVAGSSVATQIGNTLSLGGLSGYRKGLGFVGNRLTRGVSSSVSQPLGMTAYDLNKSLKNTGALNKSGLVGAAARGLSNNVLQPVSKTSFAGEKSFSQLASEADHKAHENKDRDLLEKARKVNNPITDLSDKEKDQVNRMSPNMYVGLSTKDMEKVSTIFTEETTKKIRENDKVGDDAKHAMDHSWPETSEHAPLQKADKLVDEVANTNKLLGDLVYTVDKQTYKLSELSKNGTKINKARLDAVKETISQKLDEAQTTYQTAQIGFEQALKQNAGGAAKIAKDAMLAAKTTERNASDALKKVEKLADETAKVPANPDHGRNKKGEFDKK